jgi:hypothetical protein
VAGKALAFDPTEHVGEVEVARARLQMHLVAVAPAIGESDLLDPTHVEGIDKARHPFGNEMGMVDGERELERR